MLNKLMKNWGEKANALQCKAYFRYYDPLSKWQCYIYAINPDDSGEIACIIDGFTVEVTTWRLSDMFNCFNAAGEGPLLDKEFRPRDCEQILKTLRGEHESR